MPRPLCFMIMPYGRKPTQAGSGQVPAEIDYDALWDRALRPFIEEDLGYEPIRADQDLGALIIQEMIERLAFADLVIAEVSTPNANVYYEIGVRHAARKTGCVMISADWSRQLFDIAQMRQVRYPLPEGDIADATAAGVRAALGPRVPPLVEGTSPVFEALPGFPDDADPARAASFRRQMTELTDFRAAVRAARRAPPADAVQQARAIAERYGEGVNTQAGVRLEILSLLRDVADWGRLLEFIDAMPDSMRELPMVREQRCLARAKTGDALQAIAALEELIEVAGETSERRGLLGGRYKTLWKKEADPARRATYLDRAIDQYRRGMSLDLNDYYPSSNLPRLLRTRGRPGDEAAAHAAAVVAQLACERAEARNPADPWVRPTRLGAAFDAGDVAGARRLLDEIRIAGAARFQLESTLPDLDAAVALIANAQVADDLRHVLDEMRALV